MAILFSLLMNAFRTLIRDIVQAHVLRWPLLQTNYKHDLCVCKRVNNDVSRVFECIQSNLKPIGGEVELEVELLFL